MKAERGNGCGFAATRILLFVLAGLLTVSAVCGITFFEAKKKFLVTTTGNTAINTAINFNGGGYLSSLTSNTELGAVAAFTIDVTLATTNDNSAGNFIIWHANDVVADGWGLYIIEDNRRCADYKLHIC